MGDVLRIAQGTGEGRYVAGEGIEVQTSMSYLRRCAVGRVGENVAVGARSGVLGLLWDSVG
jgi:hypothetical protein